MGRMVFQVLASVAELERQLIKERVRNGLKNAKAKGRRIGAPKKFDNAELFKELQKQNLPYSKIAELVGCSESTVCRALKVHKGG
jgi:putative DNA-invertase from lambdoid prophage Rac